jgi:8-oxoguanine deaminase
MRLWIKNPQAILAENAAGGIVVSNKKIVALVKINEVPPHDQVFDASLHWF